MINEKTQDIPSNERLFSKTSNHAGNSTGFENIEESKKISNRFVPTDETDYEQISSELKNLLETVKTFTHEMDQITKTAVNMVGLTSLMDSVTLQSQVEDVEHSQTKTKKSNESSSEEENDFNETFVLL